MVGEERTFMLNEEESKRGDKTEIKLNGDGDEIAIRDREMT